MLSYVVLRSVCLFLFVMITFYLISQENHIKKKVYARIPNYQYIISYDINLTLTAFVLYDFVRELRVGLNNFWCRNNYSRTHSYCSRYDENENDFQMEASNFHFQ